jgi:hypothetical protein
MKYRPVCVAALFFGLMIPAPGFSMAETIRRGFSLKEDYRAPPVDLHSLFRGRAWDFGLQDTRQAGTNPVVAQIREEIAQLKKKKNTSLALSIVCAVAGGAFMYGFFTYGEQIEHGRDPSQQDRTKDPIFSRKRLYLLGAATAFAVSITLYFDVAKKRRAIKAREEELNRLREVQALAPAGFGIQR